MRGWVAVPAAMILVPLGIALNAVGATAQVTDVGIADSVFTQSSRTPIMYDTSYDRDVSSGTWVQTLSYSFARPRVTFSTSGNYTAVDLVRSPGLGGQNGTIDGQLNFRATKNWALSLYGNFNHLSSHDIVSETTQRQNRLRLSSQYTVSPLRMMNLVAVLSTELQEDHGLTVRPIGRSVRLLTRYDASGDSVGVDSVFVHDQRDSTFMSGRQDGLNVSMDWRPKQWLQVTGGATGTRVNPRTHSNLRDFGNAVSGSPVEIADRATFESPNLNEVYQSKVAYTGSRGLLSWISLRHLQSDQQYFDKLLRSQEHLSVNQRGGNAHLEYPAFRGGQVSVDGTLNRSLSQYALRANRNSLVSAQSIRTSFNYLPSPASRAGVDFSVDRRKNERQTTGNGVMLTRSLLASGAQRLSRRLGLDAAGNVSLTSSQYVDPILDEDNLRTYVNVGGNYIVSDRCNTAVHFSTIRGHSIAIDATRSGNNSVQSTYQMDAVLRLEVTSKLRIVQLYLINAIYQIYDDLLADSRNTLSRIKRIDTTVSDSLTSFATIQLTHNYLFRDSGSFSRPSNGGNRLYSVGSETIQQTLSATLNARPAPGIEFFATQSLGHTTVHFPSTDTRTIDNRWNLALGGTVDRTIAAGASLRGSVQHIGAYTERRNPGDLANEQDDWIAGVTLHKEF